MTGQISLIKEVDRETSATLTINVKAIDGGTPSRSADATVTFTIGDVNDVTPVFARDIYTANVDEGITRVVLSNSRKSYCTFKSF